MHIICRANRRPLARVQPQARVNQLPRLQAQLVGQCVVELEDVSDERVEARAAKGRISAEHLIESACQSTSET